MSKTQKQALTNLPPQTERFFLYNYGMNKFIAFLRAINVGGHKSVKMEDLRQFFESFGLANVQTYIQSGNVIFDWKDNDAAQPDKLEDQLEKELGYKVDIFLRTLKEVTAIANQKTMRPCTSFS